MTICKRIILILWFLFMTFVQNQEIAVPENVGYITELIANYCYKGPSHNILGPTGVNLFKSCPLLDINMLL